MLSSLLSHTILAYGEFISSTFILELLQVAFVVNFLCFFCFSFHPSQFVSGEQLALSHGSTYQSFQKLLKDPLS